MLSKIRPTVRVTWSREADGAVRQLGGLAGRDGVSTPAAGRGGAAMSSQAGLGRPTPPLHQVMGVNPSNAWEGKRPVRMPSAQHVPEGRGAPSSVAQAMGKNKPGKRRTKAAHKGQHMPFTVTGSSQDRIELAPDREGVAQHMQMHERTPMSAADVREKQAEEIGENFGPDTMAGADARAGRHIIPDAADEQLSSSSLRASPVPHVLVQSCEVPFQDHQGKRRLKKLQNLAQKARSETQRLRASILGSQAPALPPDSAALFLAGSTHGSGGGPAFHSAQATHAQEAIGLTHASVRSYSTSNRRQGGGIALATAPGDQVSAFDGGMHPANGEGQGQQLVPWFSPGFGPGYTPKDAGGKGYEANQTLQVSHSDSAPSQQAAQTRLQDIFATATASLSAQGSAGSPMELAQQIAAKAQEAVHQVAAVVKERAPDLAASATQTAQQVLDRVQAEPAVQEAMQKAQDVLSKENLQSYAQQAKERAPDIAAAAAVSSLHVAGDAVHVLKKVGGKMGSLAADMAGATKPGATLAEKVKPVATAVKVVGSYAAHAAKEQAAAPGYGAVRVHAVQSLVSLWAFFVNAFQVFNLGADILWAGTRTALGVGAGLAAGNRAGRIEMPAHETAVDNTQPTGDVGRMTDTEKAPIFMHVPRSDADQPGQFVAEAGPESAALFDNDRPFVLGQQPVRRVQGLLDRDEHLESPMMGWARAAVEAAEAGPLRGHAASTAGQHFPPSHSSTSARGFHTLGRASYARTGMHTGTGGKQHDGGLIFTDATGVGEVGQGGEQQWPEELPPSREAGVQMHGTGSPTSIPTRLAEVTSVIGEGGGALEDAEETETGVADWLGVQPLDAGSAPEVSEPSGSEPFTPAPGSMPAASNHSQTRRTDVHILGPRSFSTLASRLYPVRPGLFPTLTRSMGTSTSYQFENTVADVTAKAPDARGLGQGEFQWQWIGMDSARPGAGKGNVLAGQDNIDTGKVLHKDPHTGRHVWKFREHFSKTGARSGVLHDFVANGVYGFTPNDPRWMVERNRVRRQSRERMASSLRSVFSTASADRLVSARPEQPQPGAEHAMEASLTKDAEPEDIAASLQRDVGTSVTDDDILEHMSGLPPAVTWGATGMPQGTVVTSPPSLGGGSATGKRAFHTSSRPLRTSKASNIPSTGAGESNPAILEQAYPAGLEIAPDMTGEGGLQGAIGPGRVKWGVRAAQGSEQAKQQEVPLDEEFAPDSSDGGVEASAGATPHVPWGEGDYARRIAVSMRYAYGGNGPAAEPAGEFVYSSPFSSPISDELEYAASESMGSNSDSDEASLATPGKVVRHRRLGPPQAQGWDDLTTDDLRELAYGSLATKWVRMPTATERRQADPAWAGSGPREGTILPEGLPYDPEGEHEGFPSEVVRARKGQAGVQAAEDAKGDSFSG